MVFASEAALIALREGLEAFLIVGILLGFVTKLGRPDARPWVWLGLAAGVVLSVLTGLLVQVFLLDAFEDGGGAAWFELVAALTAVGVLTYMVFWMWKHTRTLMAGLRQQVGDALNRNTLWLISVLTFASVLREGLEVVLFYGALGTRYSGIDLAWSGIIGAALSILIVVTIFRTTTSFNLQKFFAATGALLILIAAGLLVHATHAATDAGLLPHQDALWDTSGAIPDDRADGRILHALIGYTAQPSLLQALLYFGYVFGVGIPYLASLGLYRRRPEGTLRRARAAATALLVALALGATVAGAAASSEDAHEETQGGHDDRSTSGLEGLDLLLQETRDALAAYPGRIGILVRDHGEIVSYNATTYQSIKEFIIHLWPYTGLPAELLTVDQGTYFIDDAHPFDAAPQTDPRLVDAWLGPGSSLAVPVTDPLGVGIHQSLGLNGHVYFAPGPGPGFGEGDLFEIYGLGAYRDWLKMDNYSPRYHQGAPSWAWLETALTQAFGDRVVVAFAHGHDARMDPQESTHAAAHKLANANLDVILDAYQSSIHSDTMNTCMMAPHTERLLRAAGYAGPVVPAGQAGHQPLWGTAVADRVAELVADAGPTGPIAVHLVQHGSRPGSPNPCGTGTDQYHANAAAEYELSSNAVLERLAARGNVTVRHVYGQGAEAADDGVLSPLEALALDESAGIREVIMLPYEFWGDGVDTLVYFREGLGFEPEESPYYDTAYETRLTWHGIAVRIASSDFSIETKSAAELAVIAQALRGLTDP